jgi:hypothetical protein
MSTLRTIINAFIYLKPLEITLFIMNLALVVEVWHEIDQVSFQRSENIKHYVMADIATDNVLALCLVRGH